MNNRAFLDDFQKKNPTRTDKEKALRGMSNAQIDKLIDGCGTVQGKIFYSKFKTDQRKK